MKIGLLLLVFGLLGCGIEYPTQPKELIKYPIYSANNDKALASQRGGGFFFWSMYANEIEYIYCFYRDKDGGIKRMQAEMLYVTIMEDEEEEPYMTGVYHRGHSKYGWERRNPLQRVPHWHWVVLHVPKNTIVRKFLLE